MGEVFKGNVMRTVGCMLAFAGHLDGLSSWGLDSDSKCPVDAQNSLNTVSNTVKFKHFNLPYPWQRVT